MDSGHAALITGSEEFAKIRNFVTAAKPSNSEGNAKNIAIDLDELNTLVDQLKSDGEKLNILYSIKNVFETEHEHAVFRALVLVEKIYEHSMVPINVLHKVLGPTLEAKKTDANAKIAIKSAKILAILEHMKGFKSMPTR